MNQKFLTFSLLFFICLFNHACGFFNPTSDARNTTNSSKNDGSRQISKDYLEAKPIATIRIDWITESSGIAASAKNKDVFWTHNDSGGDAFLYAFDRQGKNRGVFKVKGAKNVDWEDIASYTDKAGESYLFIGDIGNNEKDRAELVIYRVREPEIKLEDARSNKSNPRETESAEAIRIKYPSNRTDAETLLANPENSDLYILGKNSQGNADIYKLAAPYSSDKTNTLENVGKIGVPSLTPGFLTGGAISPDGKRLVLCDYFAAYEMVLPTNAKKFDEIWKQTPSVVELGQRAQGEAVCYRADGRAIMATSEKKNSPLIEVERR